MKFVLVFLLGYALGMFTFDVILENALKKMCPITFCTEPAK